MLKITEMEAQDIVTDHMNQLTQIIKRRLVENHISYTKVAKLSGVPTRVVAAHFMSDHHIDMRIYVACLLLLGDQV